MDDKIILICCFRLKFFKTTENQPTVPVFIIKFSPFNHITFKNHTRIREDEANKQ
ncbi:hypothetical protein BpHYR1_030159 [Brachionus plicatilis]|uniref:Uncharacterized protein n=1 Tax=Brachionus plicatilis TaxID=10195 RepID=A0A3M7R8H6_BRAPC|nr:hypothetical protein BpHYR1_030159 [Brachionus plicatilis]